MRFDGVAESGGYPEGDVVSGLGHRASERRERQEMAQRRLAGKQGAHAPSIGGA